MSTSFVDPKWWEDLPQIDSNLRDKLDSDPTLNEITRVLFKESKDGKTPGDDGLKNRYYKRRNWRRKPEADRLQKVKDPS
jgi:hypothetical protein